MTWWRYGWSLDPTALVPFYPWLFTLQGGIHLSAGQYHSALVTQRVMFMAAHQEQDFTERKVLFAMLDKRNSIECL